MSSLQSRPGHWLLWCPLCKSRFSKAAGALVHRTGHSFDLAREGYINLLYGESRRPAAGGESPLQLGTARDSSVRDSSTSSRQRSSGKSRDRREFSARSSKSVRGPLALTFDINTPFARKPERKS